MPHRKPPSQTWRTFLTNHVHDLVSVDFLTVPTVAFRVFFVFIVLSHHRRRVMHFNVTEQPTAAWAAQQIVEAFPWGSAPSYLLRDRDGIYGDYFQRRVDGMGIDEVLIARRSPWQNPYAELAIGSIRRECLDHMIVLNEWHLRRIITSYLGIITRHGLTCHWTKMRRRVELSSCLTHVRWLPCPTSVGSITSTFVSRPEQPY